MIAPLAYSSNSSNVAFYGQDGPECKGRVWAQVLMDPRFARDPETGGIKVDRSRPWRHSVTVYREGEGEVARVTYETKRNHGDHLSARIVTRLVREALA